MTYTIPKIPKGYSFVAAGALKRTYDGVSVYVKYRPGKKAITVRRSNPSYIWYDCPDRELVITVNSHKDQNAFYPYGDSFDECIDFNVYNDDVCKGLGIDYIMTNYSHDTKSKNNRLISNRKNRIQVLSDSGGLQLVRGTKGGISPLDLINYYNDNVDAGMILDLPLFFSDKDLAKKAAKLQRKNSDYMLSKSKGVELLNIFHGQTAEERMMFRDIVEDPKIPRVAIGGLSFFHPTACVDAIYETIYGSDLRYKQYHVLGVYTSTIIPVLVKLANSSGMHITSDSTSNIQSAISKTYHFQFDTHHKMVRLAIGSRASEPNTMRHLPCQCKVCTTIKYMDILGFGDMRFTSVLLSLHNASEMSRHAASLQEACQNMTTKEYNHLVATQLKKSSELQDILCSLDYIDMATSVGHKKAKQKHKVLVGKRRFEEQIVPPPLYGENLVPDVRYKFKENFLQQMKLMQDNLKRLK